MTNKSHLSIKRKRYYTMIYTYEARRDLLRERYKGKNRHLNKNNEYRDAVKKINSKIKTWKKDIRRIDNLSERLNDLERTVKLFTGTTIRDVNGQNIPSGVTLAKSIYYKFALENGIRGVDAIRFIGGSKSPYQALAYRKRFTTSFKSKPKNKEAWMQFKAFYLDPPKKIAF